MNQNLQNKKLAFQEFLFGFQQSIASTEIQNDLKDKIESLENQVNSLQQKVIQLEAKFMTGDENYSAGRVIALTVNKVNRN